MLYSLCSLNYQITTSSSYSSSYGPRKNRTIPSSPSPMSQRRNATASTPVYGPRTVLVHMNWKGGPSKSATLLSSAPVTSLKGRELFQSTELMTLLWPDRSPFTLAPVSIMNTCENLQRGTQIGEGGYQERTFFKPFHRNFSYLNYAKESKTQKNIR